MTLDTQSGHVADGLYNAFRENGEPTFYGPSKTPVRADILETGLIFAASILAAALLTVLVGFPGKSKIYYFVWVVTAVLVGAVILVSQFSYRWETAEIDTSTKYKAGTGAEINATVGLHIGLGGVNITLQGEPVHQLNETINYNEHLSFSTRQGRPGYGPFANHFNQEYRAAQFRGLPLPILWIAEYLTLDGEGLRWGRLYRESGFYAGICLWISFGFWILTNILVFILLRYAAYMSALTGVAMCVAVVFKHFMKAPLDLVIPFTAQHKIAVHYGTTFWLCLATGFLCITIGLLVFIGDLCLPRKIASFFGVSALQDEENLSAHKEGTCLSGLTVSTEVSSPRSSISGASTISNDLLEVVVEPGANKQHANSSPPPPYQEVATETLRDNSTGQSNEWEDMTNTDDEFEEDELSEADNGKSKTTRRRFLDRFQRPRRIPSAVPKSRGSHLTARKPVITGDKPKPKRNRIFGKSRISPAQSFGSSTSSENRSWSTGSSKKPMWKTVF